MSENGGATILERLTEMLKNNPYRDNTSGSEADDGEDDESVGQFKRQPKRHRNIRKGENDVRHRRKRKPR